MRTLKSAIILSMVILAPIVGTSVTSAQDCDPIQVDKLLPGDGAEGDYFGDAVAISGDTAIVGAPQDDDGRRDGGSAYFFRGDGSGNWIQIDKIIASDASDVLNFGSSVAISGDTAIVGRRAIAAYVFRDDGTGDWVEIARITPSDGSGGYFGSAVAICGDTAIVGAFRDDDNGIESGAAYVFRDDGAGNWVEIDKILPSDGAERDRFGLAVAISGSRAIVASYLDDDRGTNSGSAYIFQDDGFGNWIEIAKLTASDGSSLEEFGNAVAISGDTVVVGVKKDDNSGVDESGSAYVFRDDGNGNWIEIDKLTASNGRHFDWFGESVAISGDSVVVGVGFDDTGGSNRGSAHVFRDDGTGNFAFIERIVASDGSAEEQFGHAVGLSGNNAVIGAKFDSDNGLSSGSAYLFDLRCPIAPVLSTLGSCPGPMRFKVEGATNNERVAYLYARGEGSFEIPPGNPCAGTTLGLNRTVQLADVVRADASGVATLDVPNVPNAACGRIYVQALDLETCGTTNVVLVQ